MTKFIQTRTIRDITDEIIVNSGLDDSQANPLVRHARGLAAQISKIEATQNDGLKRTLLPYAEGTALDALADTYYRDLNNNPIARKENETDEQYRERLRLSRKGYGIGTLDAYTFYAASSHELLNTDNTLAFSPSPMEIEIGFIVDSGRSVEVKNAIERYLVDYTASGDRIVATAATATEFEMDIDVYIHRDSGFDHVEHLAQLKKNIHAHCDLHRKIGGTVSEYGVSHAVGQGLMSYISRIVLNGWSDVICAGNRFPELKKLQVHIHDDT